METIIQSSTFANLDGDFQDVLDEFWSDFVDVPNHAVQIEGITAETYSKRELFTLPQNFTELIISMKVHQYFHVDLILIADDIGHYMYKCGVSVQVDDYNVMLQKRSHIGINTLSSYLNRVKNIENYPVPSSNYEEISKKIQNGHYKPYIHQIIQTMNGIRSGQYTKAVR